MTVRASAAQIKGNYETLRNFRWSELRMQLSILREYEAEWLDRAWLRNILSIRTTSYKRIEDPNSLPLGHVATNSDRLID
jgi:hypothetical protein